MDLSHTYEALSAEINNLESYRLYYVLNPHPLSEEIIEWVRLGGKGSLVLTGHRGVGKSTELWRIGKVLGDEYSVYLIKSPPESSPVSLLILISLQIIKSGDIDMGRWVGDILSIPHEDTNALINKAERTIYCGTDIKTSFAEVMEKVIASTPDNAVFLIDFPREMNLKNIERIISSLSPLCSGYPLITAVPISTIWRVNNGEVKVLPPISENSGIEDIVRKRVYDEFIPDDVLSHVIGESSRIIGDVLCLLKSITLKMSLGYDLNNAMNASVSDIRNSMCRALGTSEIERLNEIKKHLAPTIDDVFYRLIDNNYILEVNGEYIIHPFVKDVLSTGIRTRG